MKAPNSSKSSVILFAAMLFLFCAGASITSNAQSGIRLSATGGIGMAKQGKTYFTAVLNAGYEVNGVSLLYDQRHSIGLPGAYFGLNSGYTYRSGIITVRPYVGYWMKYVGNASKEDRFIKDGNVETLATGREVNSSQLGGGIQFSIKNYRIDAGYHGLYSITIGMGGLLGRK